MNTKCCKAHSLKLIRIAYKQKKCTQSITICWLWAHTYQPNIGPTSIPHPTTYNKYTNQIIHSNQDLNHLIFLNMFHVPNVLHKNYQTTFRNSTFIIPIINQMHTKKIFWNFEILNKQHIWMFRRSKLLTFYLHIWYHNTTVQTKGKTNENR